VSERVSKGSTFTVGVLVCPDWSLSARWGNYNQGIRCPFTLSYLLAHTCMWIYSESVSIFDHLEDQGLSNTPEMFALWCVVHGFYSGITVWHIQPPLLGPPW